MRINRILLSTVVLATVFSLLASCSPSTTTVTTTEPTQKAAPAPTSSASPVSTGTLAAAVPKYGGTLSLQANADPSTWDPIRQMQSVIVNLVNQQTFEGDWTKGPAGGYGTRETDWAYANSDLFEHKSGRIAESVKWTVDASNDQGSIVYQIRKGMHWALNPNSEASVLVKGREVTADDVVFSFQWATTYAQAYVYMNNPELRVAQVTKTGPWEVTIRVPLAAMIMAISRFNDNVMIVPPEVVKKYGNMEKWDVSVGTGPFFVIDYVSGSVATLDRNQDYWMKDPIGPGKGNQLPYIDRVKVFIVPDPSTRLAGLRTGKIDTMSSVNREDSISLKQTAPGLIEYVSTSFQGRGNPALAMRIDRTPFTDIRVRRAMNMAIDFNAILKSYFGGEGQIYTWPYSKIKEYQDLYLDFNDYPASAKELYSYDPEKAKQLLKEAGYPNGFKTSIILIKDEVDFVSIYKDYLSRIGIDMSLDVKENAVKTNINNNRSHTAMITGDTAPISIFFNGQQISGRAHNNRSMVDDPYINEELIKIRTAMLADTHKAMKMYRDLTKYVVDQAYVITAVTGSYHTLWWPWLKNYSGELMIGFDDPNWAQFIWYDTAMKRQMGY